MDARRTTFQHRKQARYLYAEVIQLALKMALLRLFYNSFWSLHHALKFVTGVFPTAAWRIESGRDHVYHCVCLSGWCVMTTPACFSRRSRCLKACVSRGWGTGSNRYVPDTEEGVPLSEMGNMGKTTTGAKRRVLSPTYGCRHFLD